MALPQTAGFESEPPDGPAQATRGLAIPIKRVFWLLVLAFGAVVGASAAQNLALAAQLIDEPVWVLEVDVEQSVYTWASTLLLALNAAFLAIVGASDTKRRLAWWALSLLFILVSADEIVGGHERLSAMLARSDVAPNSGIFFFAWVSAALVFLVVTAAAFTPFLLSLPRATAFGFVLAGGIYVTGAVGFEMIAGALFEQGQDAMQPAFRAAGVIEEALEGLGQLIFLRVLLQHLAGLAREWRVTLA